MVNETILNIVNDNFFYRIVGECNGCQLCEFIAPSNFARVRGKTGFEVVQQPQTWEEREQCYEAMGHCPLRGIQRSPVRYIPDCEH